MDMWNWLMDCYWEGSLTMQELEDVMVDDIQATILWEDWAADSGDFINHVREEVKPFLEYIKKEKIKKNEK